MIADQAGAHDIVKVQVEDYTDERVYNDTHLRMAAEIHTGNHGPRNHPTRVPTRAGEPVRG